MSSDHDMADPSYACPCLNVRLYNKHLNGDAVETSDEKGWRKIYVGEDGIQITHVDMTLRTRAHVQAPTAESSEALQHTLLTCLACRTPAYRTLAKLVWPLDVGLHEGPVVPSDEWLETEVLKSADGWIDVNVSSPGCETGVSLAEAMQSPRYSKTFSLLMPASVLSTPLRKTLPLVTTERVLPALPQLFTDPPSHPMHQHLSMLATGASNEARHRAEEELSALVKQRTEELQKLDATLRREVELLWTSWREARHVQSEEDANRERELALASTSPPVSRVTDFIPSHASQEPRSATPVLRQSSSVSLLSMSLADPSILMSYRPSTEVDDRSDSAGRSTPSTPGEVEEEEEPENAIPIASWRRMTGSSHLEDVAMSVKVSRMEASAIIRGRAMSKSQLVTIDERSASGQGGRESMRGRVGVEEVAASKERVKSKEREKSKERDKSASTERASRERTPKSQSRVEDSRSKRVTFDEDTTPEKDQSKARKPPRHVEPIFEFDDDELPEKPVAKEYVPLMPGRAPADVTASPRIDLGASYFGTPRLPNRVTNGVTPSSPSLDVLAPEMKLQQLVAGHTPSHRAVWKDGKGWDTFVKNFGKDKSPRADEEEEELATPESAGTANPPPVAGPSRHMVPASAPIDISPLARRRYSSLNYDLEKEPKTSLTDRPGFFVPPLRAAIRKEQQEALGKAGSSSSARRSTSGARRKASYAKRDISAHLDPGPIFELGTSGEEEEDFEGLTSSEKGRRMALNMLGKSDGLPDAGMWRSMAES